MVVPSSLFLAHLSRSRVLLMGWLMDLAHGPGSWALAHGLGTWAGQLWLMGRLAGITRPLSTWCARCQKPLSTSEWSRNRGDASWELRPTKTETPDVGQTAGPLLQLSTRGLP